MPTTDFPTVLGNRVVPRFDVKRRDIDQLPIRTIPNRMVDSVQVFGLLQMLGMLDLKHPPITGPSPIPRDFANHIAEAHGGAHPVFRSILDQSETLPAYLAGESVDVCACGHGLNFVPTGI